MADKNALGVVALLAGTMVSDLQYPEPLPSWGKQGKRKPPKRSRTKRRANKAARKARRMNRKRA